MIQLRLYVLKCTTTILCSSSKINFEDFSLKIKQLRYLLFSSQQLPAWPRVYSCIILQDECWCTLRLLLLYVTAARETNNNVYVRPTFKQAAFRQAHALLSQAFCRQTSLKKIGFHFCKVSLRQFVHLLRFYAIFNFVNWLFLNRREFELGSMYWRSGNFFLGRWIIRAYIHELYFNSKFRVA